MRQLSPDEVGTLARNVRRHRRAMGLRPVELAEYLEVSAVYLTALELGAIFRPFQEPLVRLAHLLDLADWTELLLNPDGRDGRDGRQGQIRGWCPVETPTADAAEQFVRARRSGVSEG